MKKLRYLVLLLGLLLVQGCVQSSTDGSSDFPITAANAETLNPQDYDWKKSTFKEKRTFLLGIVAGREAGCANAAFGEAANPTPEQMDLFKKCVAPYRGLNSLAKIDRSARLIDETIENELYLQLYTLNELALMTLSFVSGDNITSVYWGTLEQDANRRLGNSEVSPKEPKYVPKTNGSMIELFDQNARDLMGM